MYRVAELIDLALDAPREKLVLMLIPLLLKDIGEGIYQTGSGAMVSDQARRKIDRLIAELSDEAIE